jgi:uncharacterized protein DUF4190
MSTPPNELPQAHPATQIAGQQSAPSTTVPASPQGAFVATGPANNTLAVVSLVAGIASFFGHVIPFVGGFTLALIAIITGFMARNQIRQTGEGGSGLATAGIVIGFIHLALLAAVFVFFFGFVIAILTAIFGAAATRS